MNPSKIIGIILILVSLGFGYVGLNKISANTTEINIVGVKIDASNESGKQQGYIYVGIGVLLFIAGIYTINKNKI